MILSLISAVAKNNVIGGGNTLLWNLPADMKHFREITSLHTVIMGRKTFESIGRTLPNRRNIVITRDTNYVRSDIEVVNSLEEALRLASLEQGRDFEENQDEVEVFIIGGGEIYKQSIEKANKLYITEVAKDFEGDTLFPIIDKNIWQEIKRENHEPDEKNLIPYSFVEYTKI
ncbi:dihydrofolate reductase [Candidatus Nomurabacteria bacterium]|nr:dihydrofolate reductase [Candidatus Nomurabacteria bacterium]